MDNPTICAVMLANGRPEMVARAIASFTAQTYMAKRLLVWDTGTDAIASDQGEGVTVTYSSARGKIGALRNHANLSAQADIIAHWDSDDVSHPRRLEEQVALLQSSGKDCVGYSDMLFWDTRKYVSAREPREIPLSIGGQSGGSVEGLVNEAWIYSTSYPGAMVGSSLCYWRCAWERAPFDPRLPSNPLCSGEDWAWYKNQERVAVSSLADSEPRMICSIHGGNSSGAYTEDVGKRSEWRRAPAWDEYCSRTMQLPVAIAT